MKKELFIQDKKVTIIGTAHVSKQSALVVRHTIETEIPDIVSVELDYNRFRNILTNKKREVRFFDIFKTKKPHIFMFQYILSKIQKNISKKFDINPGVEMIQAIKSTKNINKKLLLADIDINITLNKIFKRLSFREKLKIFSGVNIKKELGKDFDINKLLNEVETGEDDYYLKKIMNIFERKNKKLKQILIDDRDKYMSYQIKKTLEYPEINHIVAVVGAGHVNGLIKNLNNNKEINPKSLLKV